MSVSTLVLHKLSVCTLELGQKKSLIIIKNYSALKASNLWKDIYAPRHAGSIKRIGDEIRTGEKTKQHRSRGEPHASCATLTPRAAQPRVPSICPQEKAMVLGLQRPLTGGPQDGRFGREA